MKRFLIIVIALLVHLVSMAASLQLESEFDLDLSYSNNILNLSEDDIDEFENNEKPDKYQIETLDDLITNFRYKLKAKNYWLGGHTQVLSISLDYDKYLENEMLDKLALAFGVNQYFSSKLNLEIKYSFSPEIYLRQYKSVLDDEYHEFEYGRNGFQAILNWDLLKNLELSPRFDFTQLYYSEWFTEYDSNVLTFSLSADYKLSQRISTEFRFARRISNADAEDAFSNPENISVLKDASYDANIFSCKISVKKLPLKSTLNLGYTHYQKFYSSDNDDDDYHIDRDDYQHTVNANIFMPLTKELKLKLHTDFTSRTTDSPYDYVTLDKEFDSWKMGITVSYDFKHKK